MAFERAADLSDLSAERPTRVEIDGVPICLVRIGDEIKAIHDTCSHQDYSLAEGIVWNNQIECALHGSMFDLDSGAPESLPATTPVPVFDVKVEGDAVLIDPSRQRNDAPMPDHD